LWPRRAGAISDYRSCVQQEQQERQEQQDEWLWGWDPTPGIVSVWADGSGRASVWRRIPETGELIREEERFRPWLLLDRLDDLAHLGHDLALEREGSTARVTYRELEGSGELRYLVSAADIRVLREAVLLGASRRFGERIASLHELGHELVLALAPEEQYLVSTGRTYFRDLALFGIECFMFFV
jgi:hypothetical protein